MPVPAKTPPNPIRSHVYSRLKSCNNDVSYKKPTATFLRLHVTLARALEEEAHDEDLQASHAYHHQTLDDGEVEDSLLGAPDGAEVSVLAGAEVFLVSADGGELGRQFLDGFFEHRCLFVGRALFGGELGASFVFNLMERESICCTGHDDVS
jgi:hypothetical protein